MSRNGGPQARTSSTFIVGVVANDSCVVSGMSGTSSFPTVLSQTIAPPSSLDAGGTFQTAYQAQLTVPASVINHFRNTGATSLTVGSQTTAEDGDTSGGGPSGAVSPNTESASATNLPQSDTTLAANTPYTFVTTYNPVTWQTGPGTGAVDFVPGTIDATITFVVHGSPTTETVTCTPPHGVGTISSTTVAPPPPTPTFQVPASTPALQNQVTAGTDGGWGATVSNTSTATVSGVSASVTVSDGGPALSYDLTGMATSGTSCSPAGVGQDHLFHREPARRGLGHPRRAGQDLGPGHRCDHLRLGHHHLVQPVVPCHHPGVDRGHRGPEREQRQGGGCPRGRGDQHQEAAEDGQGLDHADPAQQEDQEVGGLPAAAEALAVSLAGTTSTSPPPVAVTLESLAPSTEPALCPPTGSSKCEGNIIQAVGNFSAYTNKKAPIIAVLKFF